MSCSKNPCNDSCSTRCEAKCPEPQVITSNEPCVIACEDTRVIIYPPPVVVTFPGPILTTCPQETVVASTVTLAESSDDATLAESPAMIPSAPEVTRSSVPCHEICPPCIIPRPKPQYLPNYSYTFSTQWIHPCNRSGFKKYKSS